MLSLSYTLWPGRVMQVLCVSYFECVSDAQIQERRERNKREKDKEEPKEKCRTLKGEIKEEEIKRKFNEDARKRERSFGRR